MAASLYGDFQLGNCSPPIGILYLCRLLSVCSFFIFAVFTYLNFDDRSPAFEALGIIIGLCVYFGLFYAVFKKQNKTLVSIYVVYELFYMIMIGIFMIFLLLAILFSTDVIIGEVLAIFVIDLAFVLIKVFFVYIFMTLYKRIVLVERDLSSYHAQYFNGQVQINAFNNEIFPTPPPGGFGMGPMCPEVGYDLPPPNHDPAALPTYESVVVVSKEREPNVPNN